MSSIRESLNIKLIRKFNIFWPEHIFFLSCQMSLGRLCSASQSEATGGGEGSCGRHDCGVRASISIWSYHTINLLVDQEALSLLHSLQRARLPLLVGAVCKEQMLKSAAEPRRRVRGEISNPGKPGGGVHTSAYLLRFTLLMEVRRK